MGEEVYVREIVCENIESRKLIFDKTLKSPVWYKAFLEVTEGKTH